MSKFLTMIEQHLQIVNEQEPPLPPDAAADPAADPAATPPPAEDLNRANLDIKKAATKSETDRMDKMIKQNNEKSDQNHKETLQQLQLWINTNVKDKSSESKANAVLNNSSTSVTNINTTETTLQGSRGKYRDVTDPMLGN